MAAEPAHSPAILAALPGLIADALESQRSVADLELPMDAKGFYLAHKVHAASLQIIEALLRLKEWAEAEAAKAAPDTKDDAADAPDPASLISRARSALRGQTHE